MIWYPPKPTLITIDQSLFDELEKDGRYVAELKVNGDHLILQRLVNGYARPTFEFWNRDGSKFKYEPSAQLLDHLNSLDWKGDCVCDGELLHFKVRSTKHTVVLWDLFLIDGVDLRNHPYRERHLYLERIFGFYADGHPKRYDDLYISEQWKNGWREIFARETQREEVEGLVMKRLDAKLELGRSTSPVVKYMYKVRKPCGKYKF